MVAGGIAPFCTPTCTLTPPSTPTRAVGVNTTSLCPCESKLNEKLNPAPIIATNAQLTVTDPVTPPDGGVGGIGPDGGVVGGKVVPEVGGTGGKEGPEAGGGFISTYTVCPSGKCTNVPG